MLTSMARRFHLALILLGLGIAFILVRAMLCKPLYDPNMWPMDIALGPRGQLYVADGPQGTVWRIASCGAWRIAGGSITSGGDGGPAARAGVNAPASLAFGPDGSLYIGETYRVRRVDRHGTITTIAGCGKDGFGGDGGLATRALLGAGLRIAVDQAGVLYIADGDNNRVRRVDRAGVITTIAGGSEWGFAGDGGPAKKALLHDPESVAVDAAGCLYIADTKNQRVRKIDRRALITTVVGGGATRGDKGPAVKAGLLSPRGIALDEQGALYIADAGDGRVRKVDQHGVITTVWNGGRRIAPLSIRVARGSMYLVTFASPDKYGIRRVKPGGRTEIIKSTEPP